MNPFISICIPAYNRINYLSRLLDSITEQTFTNYEVVITDDSEGDAVKELLAHYTGIKQLHYYKNEHALGTPENWNESIRKANGEWIKTMHDDDWFVDNNSLQAFANAAITNPAATLIFSAYNTVYEQTGIIKPVHMRGIDEEKLRKNPYYLLRRNYVGNPSGTLIKNDPTLVYDKHFKYIVDFEFFIRHLKHPEHRFHYIKELLINVSMNDSQVTTYTAKVAAVQIPENQTLLEMIGVDKLRLIVVYDYYWRLYRNLKVRSVAEIKESGYLLPVNRVIESMIRWQSVFPIGALKNGFFSKSLMFLHYLTHYFYLPAKPTN